MTQSMTGFGKAARELDGGMVTVEVSAVNHRYLDCGMHLPPSWSGLEPVLKETVRKAVVRGRVNVWVGRKRGARQAQPVTFDAEVAKQYVEAGRHLAKLLGNMESLSLDVLAQLEGVLHLEDAEEDLERAGAVVVDALGEALDALKVMRATEGEALAADLRQRIEALGELLGVVEARLPELEALNKARLLGRLAELNAEVGVAEERVAMEVAVLSDKGDVTEEVVRLKTHMAHALALLDNDTPAGRELNFLTQEMQRESNTLGSKARDGDVTREVVRMKSELEKVREQALNIE